MNIHKAALVLFVLMAGTLAYAVNQLSIPTTFTVTGLTASPSSLNFGEIVRGTTSSPQTFTLTNTGGSTVTNIVCATSGFDSAIFVAITGCPTSLGPGVTSTLVSVTITVPDDFATGPQTGTVTVSFS